MADQQGRDQFGNQRNVSQDDSFGLSIHNTVYAFMLILANLSAFFSFLILSQSHFSTDYIIENTNTTDTASLSYKDFHGLEFTMVITVMEWIWTIGLLTVMVSVTFMEAWKLSPAMKQFITRGNMVAGFFLYTTLIACSTVSANCMEDNHINIDNYKDDGKVHHHINTFCDKVHASCVFSWFLGIAFLGAMIMEFNLINLEGHQSYVKSSGMSGDFHSHNPPSHYDVNDHDGGGGGGTNQEELGTFHNTFSYDADRGSVASVNSFQSPPTATADL
jgi:hypothetical protein